MKAIRSPCTVFCIALLMTMLLGACAPSSLLDNMALAPEVLGIAPEVLGERTALQRLSMRWPGGERSMETVVEIAGGKLNLVALAFGMRLASLEYDGKTVNETRQTPMAPPGRRMVNDLLLVAAPLEDLRQALPEGWTVVQSSGIGEQETPSLVGEGWGEGAAVQREITPEHAEPSPSSAPAGHLLPQGEKGKSAPYMADDDKDIHAIALKSDVLRREISENGLTQIVIDYFSASPWQGRVTLEHRALGYQLILDSHEL